MYRQLLHTVSFFFIFTLSASAQVNPSALITSGTVFCTGSQSTFSVSSSLTITSYTWSVFPQKDVVVSDPNAAVLSVVFPKDLTYTVTVKATTTNGTVTSTKQVPVARTARAAFSASLSNTGYPTGLLLTNYSTYTTKHYWLFSGETTRDSSESFTKYFIGSGSHTVTLLAIGYRGCNDALQYSFRISDSSSVVLPNIFSPDRDDINEIYKPITTGIKALSCYIYTREGILIHKWNDVNGFWDGRTTSGEACVNGQYIAILEAYGFDGKTYKLNSHVTLVR